MFITFKYSYASNVHDLNVFGFLFFNVIIIIIIIIII